MLRFVPAVSSPESFTAPLFTERCPAGFPSPAQDYIEAELDLNEYCIQRRGSTYFVRAIGNSMTDIGLHSGDLMVVDKAEPPRHRGNRWRIYRKTTAAHATSGATTNESCVSHAMARTRTITNFWRCHSLCL